MVDVMYAADQVAAALDTIDGLQVFNRPMANVTPPSAAVSFPRVRFDETHRRGLDRLEFQITVLVGARHERSAIERITPLIEAVKDAVEDWSAFEAAMITDALVEERDVGEVTYLACVFELWIVAGDELAPP